MLSYDDSDTPAIRRNLQRERVAWGRLSTVIAKEEAPPPSVAGRFYQAVVAAVLPSSRPRRISRGSSPTPHRHAAVEARGDLGLPQVREVLRAARVRTIGDYIARRLQTVLQAIADRPILEECRGAERWRGRPTHLYWWEQEFEEELLTEEEEEDWLAD